MRVCIVTAAQLCNNPRALKEADALHAAGHDVRVIAEDINATWRAHDDALMATRRWRLIRVPVGRAGSVAHRARWVAAGVAHRAARIAFEKGMRAAKVRDRAIAKWRDAFVRAATREPADLVVAHYLKALPAAAEAAKRLGAQLCFDAEDLHSGELADGEAHSAEARLTRAVERAWLPRCARVTASSEPIAAELARRHGIARPTVVLNAFPAESVEAIDVPDERSGALSLYWFSQVIGANRGLEDAVAALALLPEDVHLSLRGTMAPGYAPTFDSMVTTLGVAHRVHVLPFAPANELTARAAQHDVGLALEPGFSLNNRLASSNKLFTYLNAGLAIAATDTPGQRAILECVDGAALYRPKDVDALAAAIRDWYDDRARLARARNASRLASHTKYSWSEQADRLVHYLTGAPAPLHDALPLVALS